MHAPDEASLGSTDVPPSTGTEGVERTSSNVNLEDSVCPICMDYYIDTVETQCRHRFCNYCLNRWINFNPNQQCPTCRRNIGMIRSLPQLDTSITNALQGLLGTDGIQQREIIRTQRNAHDLDGGEAGTSFNQQASVLISRIRATRERIREFQNQQDSMIEDRARNRVGARNTRLTRHHIDRIFESRQPELDQSEFTPMQTLPRRSRDQARSGIPGTHSEASNRSTNRSRFQPNLSQSRRQIHSRHISEDDIVDEYSYHLRRSESAQTKIMESYREFDFHNLHMQQLFQEFSNSREAYPTRQNTGLLVDFDEEELQSDGIREIRRGTTTLPRSIRPNRNSIDSPNICIAERHYIYSTLRRRSKQLDAMRIVREDDAMWNNIENSDTRIDRQIQNRHVLSQQHPSQSGSNYQTNNRERTPLNSTTEQESSYNGRDSVSEAFFEALRHRLSPATRSTGERIDLRAMGLTTQENANNTTRQRRGMRRQRSSVRSRAREARLDRGFHQNSHVNLSSPDNFETGQLRSENLIFNLPLVNSNMHERDTDSNSLNLSGFHSSRTTMEADEEAIRESLQEILNLDLTLQAE